MLQAIFSGKGSAIALFWLRRFHWCFALLAVVGTPYGDSVLAQVLPDNTLGADSSQVEINGTTDLVIRGGAQRQENLFHSFERFGINEGQQVTFENPDTVLRVFSRVTGNLPSDILGTLRSTGAADVFLLNPNGIMFGPMAQIDIGGSLFISTADSILFDDGLAFSSGSPTGTLLSISVPVGLQYGSATSNIEVQGAALQVASENVLALLGGNVTLDSGQLTASGGRIELGGLAASGRIGLLPEAAGRPSALSFPESTQQGDVSLLNGAQVSVTAPSGGSIAVNTGNLSMANRSALNAGISQDASVRDAVAGDIRVDAAEAVTLEGSSVLQNIVNTGAIGTAGNIYLQAEALSLLSGSQLFTSTFGEGNAGRVSVEVHDAVLIDSAGDNASTSGIISSVANTATGRGGDVEIVARSLSVVNGAQLNAITFGRGNAGNLIINTRNTAVFDGANVGASGILNAVAPTGRGNGGNIAIETGTLSVTNGAQLNTITRGEGNAGNVTVTASESILIDGENPNSVANPFSGVSAIFTSVGVDDVGNQAVGNGGDITVRTSELSITNGAELNAITRGQGDAGNVRIDARDHVLVDGERQLSSTRAASAIFTSVDNNAFSGFTNLPPARGNGGDIEISTRSLIINNGAILSGLTGGQGNAGNVRITAQDQVVLDGENSSGGASGIFSAVADNLYTGQPPARGDGGDVDITTSLLSITSGAGIFANTRGLGDAGEVNITARDRLLIDGENNSGGASGIFSSVGDAIDFPPAIGNGSDIDVVAGSLSITNGGGIFANTVAQGNAGDITVEARETLLDGEKTNGSPSGLYTSVSPSAVGDGGDILMNGDTVTANGGAGIFANTVGQGDSGDVSIRMNDRISLNGSDIRTTSESSGRGGNINLTGRQLSLFNQSEVLTRTLSTDGGNVMVELEDALTLADNSTISTEAGTVQAGGDGGDITVNTRFVVADPDENSDIIADAFDGDGGNVDIIAADGVFGISPRDSRTPESDITASSQNGVSGEITVQTPEIDPSEGTLELPVISAGPVVVRSCRERLVQSGSEFIISGRGGLPQGPLDTVVTALWQDDLPIRDVAQGVEQSASAQSRSDQNVEQAEEHLVERQESAETVVEAQGWINNEAGEIVLFADNPRQVTAGQLVTCES